MEQHQKKFYTIEVHLRNISADTVILHVRVHDLLEDNSQTNIENLGKNLKTMVEKWHTYWIKNVFIPGLLKKKKIILLKLMFFNTHTSSGGIYLDDVFPGISVSKSSAADLEMLQNDRMKLLHNPLIADLKINSFRNKVTVLGDIPKDLTSALFSY